MSSTSFSSLSYARKSLLYVGSRSTRGKDVVALLLLGVMAILFPWQLSLLGYLPNSIDFILQYYPNLAFLAHSLQAGELPLWNPYSFAGTPYLADPQSGVLYLPNWPFLLLLNTADAARAIILFHYALATIATYLYLRTIRLSPGPAFVGAMVFGLSQYTIIKAAGIPLLINLAWIPVAVLLVERCLQRNSSWYALGAAAALTMQLFNGWLHGLYITAFALLATYLWHAVTRSLAERSWRPALKCTGLMALAASVWAALGAMLLLPAVEYMSLSNYLMGRGLEQAGGSGNVTVLALFGVGGTEGHDAYIGGAATFLMLLGALFGQDRGRRWLYLALGGFALLTSFGTKAPLYGILYQWVPGFQTFHTPGRFMVLYLLSSSALAAMGTDILLKGVTRRQLLAVTGTAILLLAPLYYTMSRMYGPDTFGELVGNLLQQSDGPFLWFGLARHISLFGVATIVVVAALVLFRVPTRLGYCAVVTLLAADLFLALPLGGMYFSKAADILQPSTLADRLNAYAGNQGQFRVLGYARNGENHFLSDFPKNLVPDLTPPNLGMVDRLEDVQGYNPLQLRRYAEYIAAINGGPDDYHWSLVYNLQSKLLDLLNVRYVMLRGDDARTRNVTIATNLNLQVDGQSITVRPKSILASGLQVYSYLGNSVAVPDGRTVARLRVVDADGHVWSSDLRAGIDTAEWAYDRPDLQGQLKHQRARVAMTWNVPYPVHTYVTDLTFPTPMQVVEVTLERVEPGLFVTVPEVTALPVNSTPRYQLIGDARGTELFRNNLALPRALMVPRAEVVQQPEDALERIQRDGFDPRQLVVLEGPGFPKEQGSGLESGDVISTSSSDNAVRLQLRVSSYGFLLLNELSYPGWNAYLDGQRTRVWRANYLFRAIEVPPGEHEVEFRFEPDSLKLGLALSLPTLALLLAAAVFHFKTRQHRKENTTQ